MKKFKNSELQLKSLVNSKESPMQANKCKVEVHLLIIFHIAIAMSDYHSDYGLTIKVKSSVSATLHTNRFTQVPFSLKILQAHKTSAVMQCDERRS